jgi:hypothetical protein
MSHARLRLVRPCPFCQQGVSLHLLTCPECRRVIAACDEAGCVYDPKDLSAIGDSPCDVWYSTWTKCPYCRSVAEFTHATVDEVEALGLSKEHLAPSGDA